MNDSLPKDLWDIETECKPQEASRRSERCFRGRLDAGRKALMGTGRALKVSKRVFLIH